VINQTLDIGCLIDIDIAELEKGDVNGLPNAVFQKLPEMIDLSLWVSVFAYPRMGEDSRLEVSGIGRFADIESNRGRGLQDFLEALDDILADGLVAKKDFLLGQRVPFLLRNRLESLVRGV
jgi:hypothetical protein